MEQAGSVLGDHLNERAARGAGVVKLDLGVDLYLGEAGFLPPETIAQHSVEIDFAQQDADDAALEPLPFLKVELQGAKTIREIERVHHRTRLVGEGVGLDDVHTPVRLPSPHERGHRWPSRRPDSAWAGLRESSSVSFRRWAPGCGYERDAGPRRRPGGARPRCDSGS